MLIKFTYNGMLKINFYDMIFLERYGYMAKTNKKVLRYLDKPLLIVTVLLFIIGLIMVFSSSNVTAYMSYAVSPYNYFIKQGIFLFVGLVLFLVMIRFNTKFYGMFSWLILIALSASLVILLVYGKATNNAVSWFDFGPFSFQPSEFIKVVFIIWMARFYEVKEKKLNTYTNCLFPPVVAGGIALLIMLQPDLGTTIIFGVIVFTLFMAAPLSKVIKAKTLFGVMGFAVVVLLVLLTTGNSILLDRQASRFDFKKPCDKLLTTGSQVCNGYIAINNGGLTGVGLGNSTQKYLYLPEPYTDFIFAIIVEEMGAIFGIAIILMYMFVLYRILAIGRKSYTNRGALMCYGIAIYIFCHIAINLLGLFGLMPLTGVPLPFMSYGGSFTICLVAALTVVQRVNVENKIRDNIGK